MVSQGNITEKLKNAIIYFVNKDKTVKLTKLMKLLYYLDFRHYRETGFSITGQEYTAWPMGPVPVDVWAEISRNQDRGCGLKDFVKTFKVDETLDAFGYDLKILGAKKFSDKEFSARELKILQEVSAIFKNVSAKLMIDATHMPGQPWEKTCKTKNKGAIIAYDLALEGCSAEHCERIYEEQEDRKALERFFGVAL